MVPWRKILFSLCVFFGTLFLLECGCRLAGLGARKDIHEDIANWEREYQGEFFLYRPQENLINNEGLRDYPHAVLNPGKRPRIVCLGDSVTYGYGLHPKQAYPWQLQLYLKEHINAEVFNVALPGWSTRQQHIAWQRICRKYEPDLAIVGICLNDVAEMQNNLAEPPAWLKFAYARFNMVRAVVRPEAAEIAQVDELFEHPEPARVTHAYDLLFKELDQLKEELDADGVSLLVLVFPFRLQLEDGAPPPAPQKRIIDHCTNAGISATDLLSLFGQMDPEEAFLDHDHLTAAACTLLAQALGNVVLK
jgi:lysophospholipase L1-like esterase